MEFQIGDKVKRITKFKCEHAPAGIIVQLTETHAKISRESHAHRLKGRTTCKWTPLDKLQKV